MTEGSKFVAFFIFLVTLKFLHKMFYYIFIYELLEFLWAILRTVKAL